MTDQQPLFLRVIDRLLSEASYECDKCPKTDGQRSWCNRCTQCRTRLTTDTYKSQEYKDYKRQKNKEYNEQTGRSARNYAENKQEITERLMEIRERNRDVTVSCGCGSSVTKLCYGKHKKTKKHLDWGASLEKA